MFERYSEHARSVMSKARQEAQNFKHDHIGTEHLLLGLLEVKNGIAAKVLGHRDVNLAHAKEQVEKLATQGDGAVDGEYDTMPRTKHVQEALDYAVEEARQLKHNWIGTEHLLLGLLYENEGIGAQVLKNLGLKLDDVRDDTIQFVRKAEEN
jgi:ATP-dependent Clp protease ATP-binding subunit ClpC